MIDWNLTERTAITLASRGPRVSSASARTVVEQLHELSQRAIEPVRSVTGLNADDARHHTRVVARPEWIRANIIGFQRALDPLVEKAASASPAVRAVGSRATALEMGAALSWLSSKVLGQYDVFGSGDLLLVAPNIHTVEEHLQVDPRDFRLWVCLHEETHRVQFGAVPWLSDYVTTQTHAFLNKADISGRESLERLIQVIKTVGRILAGDERASVIDAVQTPDQRVVFDRLTALMTLLEGHADVVMDAVGPDVIPSVTDIRRVFDQRRGDPNAADGFMRRLLGMDAKLRQYTEGAKFVKHVVADVGMADFNRIWSSPETLPTMHEIATPAAWIDRVVRGER